MMFTFHSAIALALIAIALGIGLFIWGMRQEGVGASLAKIVGILIAIVAAVDILCSIYYAVKYWHEGYFQTPSGISTMQSKSTEGMGKMGGGMMQKH
ncbi:MAG: hypothetical protein HWD59_06670 [Coxiellaceae bacterium]|nr:MAG: hypothetical protein HWD59_06670 [Coxiellaceae bacterium]